MMRWIVFIIIYVIIDFYAFQAIKTLTKKRWIHYLHVAISFIVVGNFIYQFMQVSAGRVLTPEKSYAFGFLLTLLALKIVVVPILFGEDIFRFISGFYNKLFSSSNNFFLPTRRKFVSQIALAVAAIPFTSLLYGMYNGRYNFKVLKYSLEFDDLPDAFDGYQITQISDIHSGSFDNAEKIEYGVDLINQQKSDILLFTGDIVNNKADEMVPWMDTFKKLEAKEGKYSILGNHDYGDYSQWNSVEEKARNFERLIEIHDEMGFTSLLNQNQIIEKNGEKIAIIGVENWGVKPFPQHGDLDLAKMGTEGIPVKILLSHDPSHFEEVVTKGHSDIDLTLSGHTHGAQFGVELGNIKWSPVKYKYPRWAGMYEVGKQMLYVNRGFGYLAFPGRIGMPPEITVFEFTRG